MQGSAGVNWKTAVNNLSHTKMKIVFKVKFYG